MLQLNERAGRYDLRPLGVAGLREVVRIPAQRAGLRWSEPSLPDRIVEDAIGQRAPLPLVANLLRLLWDGAKERKDGELLENDYRELKGVAGALASSADNLLNSLGSMGKECARSLLLALVKPGRESQDTRRSVSREMALKAAGDGPQAEQVLDRLSGLRMAQNKDPVPRLVAVTQVEDGAGDTDSYQVDLAHESLLRLDHQDQPYWKTLWEWVAEDRKALQDRDLLEVLADHWEDKGRPRLSGLATRQQLKDFSQVTGARDPAPAFLRASRGLQWLVRAIFTIPLLALLVFFDGLWLQSQGLGYYDQYARARAYLGRWTGWGGFYLAPEMVSRDSGIFKMGCVSGMDCNYNEKPVKQRKLEAFRLGRTEVTFAQYDQFVIATRPEHPEREHPDDEA